MKKAMKYLVLLLTFTAVVLSCKKDEVAQEDSQENNGECMDYVSVHDKVKDARDIFFINDQEGWMVGFEGSNLQTNTKLLHTTDGGHTWTVINPDLKFGAMMHVNGSHFKIRFIDSNNGYIAIDFGMDGYGPEYQYYYTTDKGVTWQPVPLPTVNAGDNVDLHGMGVNATQMVFAAFIATPQQSTPDCYKLFFVSNATHTITNEVILECSTTGLFDYSYRPTEISFTDSGIINMFVYDSDNSTYNIAHSSDSGATWSYTVLDYSQLHHTYMQFVNDQVGFISAGTTINNNNQHFYKTTDGGASWTLKTVSNETGVSPIYRLSFADANNGLAIRQSDNELFKTSDGGDTWSKVGCFLEENPDLDINTFPYDIYYASPNKAIILTQWLNVNAANNIDMYQNRIYFYNE